MKVRLHVGAAPALPPGQRRALCAVVIGMLAAQSASAVEIDTGNPDWKVRWDNTVKASAMYRLDDASPALSAQIPLTVNQDDGDNNFRKGIVSKRLDLLSELDITGPRFGARISAAAWYDGVYNDSTNNTTFTSNHFPSSEFAAETRDVMGHSSELLDAFVYANVDLGDKPASVRLGRHTLLWGESLFFGANGIAGGQAPLDLVKLLSVPNATFKEIARPTGKLSGQVQLTPDVTVGAYVTYEWEKTRLMPVGSFLSTSDALGPGAERILAGPTASFTRTPDMDAKNSGQGGVQLRLRAPSLDTDFGFYAIQYNATTPSNIVSTLNGFPPALVPSSYQWVYHEGIKAFGASFSKTIDDWGLAGEVSYRTNTPLDSSGQTVLPMINVNTDFNNNSNPAYAVGETAHAQISWLASLGPSFISREASFVGEVAWNTRVRVTMNEQMLNPNADKSAWAMRMLYSPTYRQILPGVDLTPSIGLGYTWGRSSAVGPAFGPDKGGDLSLGLSAVYLGRWTIALNYTQFLGDTGTTLDANNNAQYMQSLKDRNNLTLSLRATF